MLYNRRDLLNVLDNLISTNTDNDAVQALLRYIATFDTSIVLAMHSTFTKCTASAVQCTVPADLLSFVQSAGGRDAYPDVTNL